MESAGHGSNSTNRTNSTNDSFDVSNVRACVGRVDRVGGTTDHVMTRAHEVGLTFVKLEAKNRLDLNAY